MIVNKSFIPTESREEISSGLKSTEEKFLENEARLSERLFAEKNNIDEKIVNNMIKLNVLFYIFTLLLNGFLFFYGDDIFGFSGEEIDMRFSLFHFKVEGRNKSFKNASNEYDCVRNATTCENYCRKVYLEELKEIFPFECSWFSKFLLAGLIVIFFN